MKWVGHWSYNWTKEKCLFILGGNVNCEFNKVGSLAFIVSLHHWNFQSHSFLLASLFTHTFVLTHTHTFLLRLI
jgi:hypothetical protein